MEKVDKSLAMLLNLRDSWAEDLAQRKYNDDKEILENCIEDLEKVISKLTVTASRRPSNGKDY